MILERDRKFCGRVSGAGDALANGRIVGPFVTVVAATPPNAREDDAAIAALREVQGEVSPGSATRSTRPTDAAQWRTALRDLLALRDRQVAAGQRETVGVQLDALDAAMSANDAEELRHRVGRLREVFEVMWGDGK